MTAGLSSAEKQNLVTIAGFDDILVMFEDGIYHSGVLVCCFFFLPFLLGLVILPRGNHSDTKDPEKLNG